MSGKTSRTKGLNFEREIANSLKHIFPDASRQLEFQENEARGVDLKGTGHWAIQCKVRKTRHVPMATINEIKALPHEIPLLISKVNRGQTLCVLPWKNLLTLLEQVKDLK